MWDLPGMWQYFVVLKNLRSVALLCETYRHRRFIQDPRSGDTLVDPE
jgi:hypothetical protein